MSFPVPLELFGVRVHPHPAFELAGFVISFAIYFFGRRSRGIDAPEERIWVLLACIAGGTLGAKLLAWIESAPLYWAHREDPLFWLGGKTIVGALLGGWVGVEAAKRRLGIAELTGDAYVFPILLGIAVGRIGCFLTGFDDGTHGAATALPWGVDLGDGVARHPVQLYESAFLLALALPLALVTRGSLPKGALFRIFVLAYLTFRFGIEFLKPTWKPAWGLSAIQVASLLGGLVCVLELVRLCRPFDRKEPARDAIVRP